MDIFDKVKSRAQHNAEVSYYNAHTSNSRYRSGETQAKAVVYDALSEGPIEGLANGSAGIYLNSTPLVNKGEYKKFEAIKTTCTVSASSTTVTVATGAIDDIDTTLGTRVVQIVGAGKQGTSMFDCTAGDPTVTSNSSWFASSMATATAFKEGAGILRISGAGPDGTDYVGRIVRYTSATEVEVLPAPATTVANQTGGIDHVTTIASYAVASNQFTLTTAAVTAVTDKACQLLPPQYNPETSQNDTSPKENFEQVHYAFRSGWKDQSPIKMLDGAATNAGFVHAPNTKMEQGANFINGGVSPTYITAANIGVTNAAEIDQIKYVIECPQLFAISTKSGTEYSSWVEFVCDFQFKRNASDDWTTVRLTGNTNSAITSRGVDTFDDGDSGTVSMHDGFIVHKTKKKFQEEYSVFQCIHIYQIKISIKYLEL